MKQTLKYLDTDGAVSSISELQQRTKKGSQAGTSADSVSFPQEEVGGLPH